MSIEAWGFLIGRNQYIDYRTIVAPAFLCEAGLSSFLARVVESDMNKPGEAFFRLVEGLKVGTIIIVFQLVEAKEKDINPEGGDTLLTDSVGREIYLTKGFVFKGNYKKEDIKVSQTDIDNVYREELMRIYGEFWKIDTTPPPPTDSKCFDLKSQNSKILDLKLLKAYQVPIKVPKFYTAIPINDEVSSIAFSPVDNKIAIRSYNTLIQIFSLSKDNKPIFFKQIGKKVSFTGFDTDKSVCFSPDGKFIVYSTVVPTEKNVINITSILSGENIQSSYGHPQLYDGRIHTIVFSPNGQIIASASNEQAIRIGFFKQEKKDLLPHDNIVKNIAISPDSHTLASGDKKGNISLWNLKTLQKKEIWIPQELKQFTRIRSLIFSPDGQTLAVAGDTNSKVKLCIWKLETQEVVEIFPQQTIVNSIAYNPVDSRILVSAGKDKTIKLWNIRSPQSEIWTLDSRHTKEVTSVAFSRDGKFLASGSKDGIVNIWNTGSI
ncbi:WD40 repeat domain-containing protein [Nostoc sp. UHCC 0926]|uniref:WD40 repeat domain-containing protein n=1 Tax=unclassified Nostoc TaxID=2593658 RepID=UPI00235E3643|nr:WD40 repeat domain-containing protein [Nostoc sp. UHCC 0926]WDD33417.1 WD40 repeat domain-containing protein [Nostoc sp. UHCC 0926]